MNAFLFCHLLWQVAKQSTHALLFNSHIHKKDMKMKRVILFLIAALSSFGSMHADNSSEARRILDKAASVVSRKSGAQASFVMTGNGAGRQTGSISIKGQKFHVDAKETVMWYNGKTLWTYIKANEEVNVTTPTAQQRAAINPYSFITLYKKGYSLSYTKKGQAYQVRMVAQKPTNVKEMYVVVNAKYVPTQVRMNQNGRWITINISGFIAKSQPDSRFVFNPKQYPSAEIIDLRD